MNLPNWDENLVTKQLDKADFISDLLLQTRLEDTGERKKVKNAVFWLVFRELSALLSTYGLILRVDKRVKLILLQDRPWADKRVKLF